MTSPAVSNQSLAWQRVFVVGFIIFFVCSALGVTIWGFQVTSKVKAQAVETDIAIRSVGWLMLAAAADHGGFPTRAAGLQGIASPEALPTVFVGLDLPADREEALQGRDPMALEDAMKILTVIWPPDATLPPVVRTDGRPSGLGTLVLVNNWLLEAARYLSTEKADEGG